MIEPVLDLLPEATVCHLGVARNEDTAEPIKYYSRIPHSMSADVGLVLDPMLATGGSSILALNALHESGVKTMKLLSIIAARDGIDAVQNRFPNSQIFVCAIDSELNARKFIVPGLGDAGDRIFNTPQST